MDSVVEQLSEIEKTAEDIVEHAEKQKAEIEHQIQNERDVFDRETEQATQEELSRIRAQAKEKMDAWVSKYGDEIECCVAGNDAMALGALSAVEAAGFNTDGEESSKYIPIYGIDALPEILSKVESGEITGSVLQDAKTQGQTIVKMAENLTSGKDAVDGIEGVEVEEEAKAVRVPYQAITKDNLDLAKSTYE